MNSTINSRVNSKIKCVVMALALTPAAIAQTVTNTGTSFTQPTSPSNTSTLTSFALQDTPSAPAPALILRDGTPVRLRLSRTLSSEQSKTNDLIDFDVLDDVRIGETVIIPRGIKAIGAITEAEHKRRMGRGGKLNLALDYVRLDDGTKVALRAERDTRGGGHVGAMSAGMAAAVIFGFGLPAPLLLLMHGKEAVVPQGTEITAYVDGDTRLGTPALAASR